jgi:hypothetical protein
MARRRDHDEAEALSALIGTIYDAALDPALWQDVIAGVCRFLDCRYGAIGALDILHSDVNFSATWGYPPEAWQSYLTEYFHKNPFNPVTFRSNVGEVICRESLMAEWPAFLESEFYKEWAQPLGIVDAIVTALDKTGSGIATLTCVRHEEVGHANGMRCGACACSSRI